MDRRCVCLSVYPGASLRSDRVEQRHGDSLFGLLESCYQVPNVTERPFLHAGSGLKDKETGGRVSFFSTASSSDLVASRRSACSSVFGVLSLSLCLPFILILIHFACTAARSTSMVL